MSEEYARADYRYIQSILQTSFGKHGLDVEEAQIEKLCEVFEQAGGSWEKVHKGDTNQIVLIKNVIKAAIKKGYLGNEKKLPRKNKEVSS
jgi:hypothetical protein